ncbi:TlpA family protein disulfide reductase [Lacinutrix salivirga]
MKQLLLVFIFSLVTLHINAQSDALKVYDYTGLESYLNKTDDTVYIINFWATWCAPCVKELPAFERINKEYTNKVEVILVSLDFPKQYETRLIPFIKNKKLQSEVIVLNDVDSNSWIPKISEDWSGAIPATLIYNKNKRIFYEQSFDYESLKKELKQFLN